MEFHRIYLGAIEPDALERIMNAIRQEGQTDNLDWYVLEAARVGRDDHPRNPGQAWVEIDGSE